MRFRAPIVALCLSSLAFGATDARAADPIEGILRILSRIRSTNGQFPPTVPRFFGNGFDDDVVGVTIRLASPPTKRDYDEITAAIGRPLPRLGGSELHFHRTVCAEVPWDRLDELAAIPGVDRIDIGKHPGTLHPMDVSVPEVQAPLVWAMPGAERLGGITGEGMLVADIDSGIDIYHPMFFQLGTELQLVSDAEFVVGETEVTLEGESVPLSLQEGARIEGGGNEGFDGRYQPSTDWLYVDGWDWSRAEGSRYSPLDANGRRDFGREDGFGEDDPGFGEPVFVLLDVAQNDRVDAEDRFILLDRSKIRAVMEPVVHVLHRDDCDVGDCLVDTRMADKSHGTGVVSVLLGGWPDLGRRFTGIAPGAELVLATNDATSFPIGAGLPFAIEERADVVLYESVYLVTSFLDGSSNDEMLLADAGAAGIPQITPTGNWGGSGKTIRLVVQGGNSAAIGAHVPDDGAGLGVSGISLVQVTLRWREPDVTIGGEIEIPGKGAYAIVPGDEDSHDDIRVLAETEVSDRGTAKLDLTILGVGETVPVGDWTFRIENPDPAVPVEIWGGGVDDRSGFAGGFVFTTDVDDSTSVAAPATADGAIGVGSYSTRDSGGAHDQGRLSGFSGQGRRIDEEIAVDVTAPGDYDVYWARDFGANRLAWGWFTGFGGGTSAAGPHVAGAAALLLEIAPWSATEDVENAIREGALADGFVGGAPNDQWGWGKLRIRDAARSLPAEPAPDAGPAVLWALQRPVRDGVEPDAGTPDPRHGNERFTARGGWDCAAAPGGAVAGPSLVTLAIAIGTLRRRRSRRG